MADDATNTDAETGGQDDAPTPIAATATDVAKFTQDDVDRIVKDRLKRQSQQFEGHAEYKAKAEELDQIREEQQSELEKAQAALAAEMQRAESAEAKAKEHLLRAAVVAEAATRKVVDPDAAFTLIDRDAIEFDDNGSPTNIAPAMDALLEAKPYLLGGTAKAAGDVDQGARGKQAADGPLTREDLQSMTPDEIVEAHKAGRIVGAGATQ